MAKVALALVRAGRLLLRALYQKLQERRWIRFWPGWLTQCLLRRPVPRPSLSRVAKTEVPVSCPGDCASSAAGIPQPGG